MTIPWSPPPHPPTHPLPVLLQVLADVKKVITDEDLLGLVGDNMDTADTAGWEVLDLHVSYRGKRGGGVRDGGV